MNQQNEKELMNRHQFTFDDHKIETNGDVMKEAVRAWKNKKSKEFLKAYAKFLASFFEDDQYTLICKVEVAVNNICYMARFYNSNGPEMKAMREYVKIEQSVKDDIRYEV